MPQSRQGTLPFKRRASSARFGRAVPIRENVVEAQADYHLHLDGCEILSTVHRYKLQTCPCCHNQFRPVGGYGATPGVPDRLVRLPDWPRGVWLGIELKGSDTAVSPAQRRLHEMGAIYVCRSADEARDALAECAEALRQMKR